MQQPQYRQGLMVSGNPDSRRLERSMRPHPAFAITTNVEIFHRPPGYDPVGRPDTGHSRSRYQRDGGKTAPEGTDQQTFLIGPIEGFDHDIDTIEQFNQIDSRNPDRKAADLDSRIDPGQGFTQSLDLEAADLVPEIALPFKVAFLHTIEISQHQPADPGPDQGHGDVGT